MHRRCWSGLAPTPFSAATAWAGVDAGTGEGPAVRAKARTVPAAAEVIAFRSWRRAWRWCDGPASRTAGAVAWRRRCSDGLRVELGCFLFETG